MNSMNNTENLNINTNANTNINFDDFLKVKMAVGKVLSAEKLEKSPKLLKLSVDFGETEEVASQVTVDADATGEAVEVTDTPRVLRPRQVLSGIAKTFQPEDLVGKSFVFVINLEPRQIMGMESQAMILAASDEQGLVLFSPTRDIASGSNLG